MLQCPIKKDSKKVSVEGESLQVQKVVKTMKPAKTQLIFLQHQRIVLLKCKNELSDNNKIRFQIKNCINLLHKEHLFGFVIAKRFLSRTCLFKQMLP